MNENVNQMRGTAQMQHQHTHTRTQTPDRPIPLHYLRTRMPFRLYVTIIMLKESYPLPYLSLGKWSWNSKVMNNKENENYAFGNIFGKRWRWGKKQCECRAAYLLLVFREQFSLFNWKCCEQHTLKKYKPLLFMCSSFSWKSWLLTSHINIHCIITLMD